jgi:ABC-type branched-subunit amino acid transport system substrate-binding protein
VIFTAPSSSRRAADPIKIGMVAPLTGPFAESGRYRTQGAKLAVVEINGAAPVQCIGPEPLCRSIASARQSP